MFRQKKKENLISKNKIEVKNISKAFSVGSLGSDLALSHLTSIRSLLKGSWHKNKFQVLDDVSFNVENGEILGIIGKNGSGKSTLLRIIAGVYRADSGSVIHHGEVFFLTSMGLGLMEKLTMKDNIYLVGSVMGLKIKKIKNIFNEITDFSELQNFVNLKIRLFSTGMIGRLGFSVSVFCMKNKKSEILLLDEVFGSGADFEFEKKAIGKMEELMHGGTTVVMVSHDLDIMQKYCNRIIWLDAGKIKAVGTPAEIIEKYKQD